MTFRNWLIWLRTLPWSLRWFVYLILLRPVIDNFYWMKEISPFLSPLVIAGILTPVLCLSATFRYRSGDFSRQDISFRLFSVLVVLAGVIFFIKHPGLPAAEFALKLTLPVYLYFFLIRFIESLDDLHGLLYATLIATYISAIFLVYEIVFQPIQEVEYSRGVERLRGGYADVMNYGIYMSLGLISASYFFLRDMKIRFFGINNLYLMLAFALVVIIKINHVASYIVFAALILLFTLYSLRRKPGWGFLLVVIIMITGSYFGQKIYKESITPMIEKDLMVLEGERETDALLHGRMGRWDVLWTRFKNAGMLSKVFGTSAEVGSAYMMSSGAHNDFLRIIFTSGWSGFFMYLFFLAGIYLKSRWFEQPESYLITATLTATVLYSVTTTPTYYANYLYIFLAILVFFTLPPEVAYQNHIHEETSPDNTDPR